MTARQKLLLVGAFVSVAAPIAVQEQNLDTLPLLRATEELRIGNAADPNLGFSIVSNLTVDRDGNVYVFEMPDMHIRVFSSTGAALRTIGRKGQGPGEFESARSVTVIGDTLFAAGNAGGACRYGISLFNRNGTFLSSAVTPGVRLALHDGVGVVSPRLVTSDGKLLGQQNCFTGGDAPGVGTIKATDTLRIPRVLFDAKGVPIDTLGFELRPPPGPRPRRDSLLIEGRWQPIPSAPSDEPLSVWTREGRVVVERRAARSAAQATVRIVHLRHAGDTASSRIFRYAPKRFPPAVLDSFAAQSARVPGGSYRIIDGVPQIDPFANPAAAAAAIRAKMSFPANQVPIQQSFLAFDGSIWLTREDDGGPLRHWIVLDPRGVARGRVDLPRRATPSWATGNYLWAVLPNDDDVPFVVRYRIGQ